MHPMAKQELKVDKDAFDSVLRKIAHSAPVKRSEVKTGRKKVGKVISPRISPNPKASQ